MIDVDVGPWKEAIQDLASAECEVERLQKLLKEALAVRDARRLQVDVENQKIRSEVITRALAMMDQTNAV